MIGSRVVLALFVTVALAPGSSRANTSGVPVPPVPKFDQSDPQRYGAALADYFDLRDTGWKDFYLQAKMTLIDPSGGQVRRDVVIMTLEQPDGDRTLVRFQSPADIRGITALIHERSNGTDDTWLYLPASRRTRRISGANRTASFQGTEYTYEDLSRLSIDRYKWKFLANADVGGEPTFKLEAIPNYPDSGYSKIVIFVHRNHWRPEKGEFYDRAGRLLKSLQVGGWTSFHGRFWRPKTTHMINHQTKKETKIEADQMFVNLSMYKRRDGSARPNLTADQFTKRALETSR